MFHGNPTNELTHNKSQSKVNAVRQQAPKFYQFQQNSTVQDQYVYPVLGNIPKYTKRFLIFVKLEISCSQFYLNTKHPLPYLPVWIDAIQ